MLIIIIQHLLCHVDETIIQPFVMVVEDTPVSDSQALNECISHDSQHMAQPNLGHCLPFSFAF